MDAIPRVSIIILNWNGWKDTIDCLDSVYQITYPNYDVIVVDNNSENESINKIKDYTQGKFDININSNKYSGENKKLKYIEYSRKEVEAGGGRENEILNFPPWRKLIIIINEKNYGFAEGNNIAIKYALNTLNTDYVLLLNNDTIVQKDFLDKMIEVSLLEENNSIIGPKIFYYDFRGRKDVIHSAGAKIHIKLGLAPPIGINEIDIGQYNEIKHVDYIEGACMLVKKNLIETIGFLDQTFFAYWEEADWCYRARKKGFNIIYVPEAQIWHKIPEKRINKIAIYLYTRNKFIFMIKNASNGDFTIFILYYVFFDFWYRLVIILAYYRNINILISFLTGNRDGFSFVIIQKPPKKSL